MEERILQAASQLFCQYGIKSITMDDIASHLGISKKTIYQYYKDKKELVYLWMEKMLGDQQSDIEEHEKGAANAIEEILAVIGCLQKNMQSINPTVFFDLQKYHPESWKLYQDYRDNYLVRRIKTNLERGISEGLYRTDLELDVMAIMRIAQLDSIFSMNIYAPAQYDIARALSLVTDHYLHGLVSLKGHRFINKCKKLNEE